VRRAKRILTGCRLDMSSQPDAIHDQYPSRFAEMLDYIAPHIVTDLVNVPIRPPQQPLHPIRRHLAGLLGQRPPVLPLQPRHLLPAHEARGSDRAHRPPIRSHTQSSCVFAGWTLGCGGWVMTGGRHLPITWCVSRCQVRPLASGGVGADRRCIGAIAKLVTGRVVIWMQLSQVDLRPLRAGPHPLHGGAIARPVGIVLC
jgi:hypothetical protein